MGVSILINCMPMFNPFRDRLHSNVWLMYDDAKNFTIHDFVS